MKEKTTKKVEMQHYHTFKPCDEEHKWFDSYCRKQTHRHTLLLMLVLPLLRFALKKQIHFQVG